MLSHYKSASRSQDYSLKQVSITSKEEVVADSDQLLLIGDIKKIV
jgi:hypothetical protein